MLCIGILVVPLFLLSTPGRATSGPGRISAPGQQRETHTVARQRVLLLARTAAFERRLAEPTGPAAATTTAIRPSSTATADPVTTEPPPDPQPAVVAVAVPATTTPPTTTAPPTNTLEGEASWYPAPAGTCASPTLPFGIMLTVTDDATGASVHCLVDDREAHNEGRVVDLAEATFAELADPGTGVIEVTLSW